MPKDQVLKDLEELARKKRLGLWVEPNPIPPWEFRKARAVKKKSLQPTASGQSLMNTGLSAMQASALDTASETTQRQVISVQILPILGNRKSHLYHRADCPNYSAIRPKNQVFFTSEGEAQAAGYQLTGNCP